MNDPVIFSENTTKKFGDLAAVKNVDLSIDSSAIMGLIGPNGAGKTTMVNMLTGLYIPTSGTIRILGKSFDRNAIDIKKSMGVMPEGLGLYELLTGEEYLHFVGYVFGLTKSELSSRVAELFEFMDMVPVRRKRIHEYSQGMKKKLALSGIFLHDPQVIFLDEPFENIDPIFANKIQHTLANMAQKGATVFITSHMLGTVEKFCSDVALMVNGEIVFTAPTDQLRSKVKNELTREVYQDLEDVFITFVEAEKAESQKRFRLSWLDEKPSVQS